MTPAPQDSGQLLPTLPQSADPACKWAASSVQFGLWGHHSGLECLTSSAGWPRAAGQWVFLCCCRHRHLGGAWCEGAVLRDFLSLHCCEVRWVVSRNLLWRSIYLYLALNGGFFGVCIFLSSVFMGVNMNHSASSMKSDRSWSGFSFRYTFL